MCDHELHYILHDRRPEGARGGRVSGPLLVRQKQFADGAAGDLQEKQTPHPYHVHSPGIILNHQPIREPLKNMLTKYTTNEKLGDNSSIS